MDDLSFGIDIGTRGVRIGFFSSVDGARPRVAVDVHHPHLRASDRTDWTGGPRGRRAWEADPWANLHEVAIGIRNSDPTLLPDPLSSIALQVGVPAEFGESDCFRVESTLRAAWQHQRIVLVPEPAAILRALEQASMLRPRGERLLVVDFGCQGIRFTVGDIVESGALRWQAQPLSYVNPEGGLSQDIAMAESLLGQHGSQGLEEARRIKERVSGALRAPWEQFVRSGCASWDGVSGGWIESFSKHLSAWENKEGQMEPEFRWGRARDALSQPEHGFLRILLDATQEMDLNPKAVDDVVLVGGGASWFYVQGWLRCLFPNAALHLPEECSSVVVRGLTNIPATSVQLPERREERFPLGSWQRRFEIEVRAENMRATIPIKCPVHFARDPHAASDRHEGMVIGLPLNDRSASRFHATIRPMRSGHLQLENHSLNGTFVNGLAVSRFVTLQHGDRLQMGQTLMYVRLAGKTTEPQTLPTWSEHAT